MKKFLLPGVLALMAMSAQASVPSSYTVTPAPNSTVQSITELTVKKSNEYYMEPYVRNRYVTVNGERISITQKANPAGNTITMTLDTPVEKSGTYEIVVPEATFTYGMNEIDNPEMSWSVTVDNPNYGTSIPEGLTVSPENKSTVEEITTLTISGAAGSIAAGTATSVNIDELPVDMTQAASADGSALTITLDKKVRTNGEMHIVVPAGTFKLNGEDSPEVAWFVTVQNSGEPEIPTITITSDPASGGTVKEFSSITFTFEGAATATRPENAPMPIITKMGTEQEMAYAFSAGAEANQIVISVAPALAVSGDYTFTLPKSAVALTADNGAEFTNDEAKVNFTVKAPVAEGEKFVVDKIRYILLSRKDMTAAVTWPEDESDYSGLTTVPTQVEYEGETFTVTEIGNLAFSEVKGLGAFTVPEGIVSIGEGAFWESSLSSISIPSTVVSLGESAFDTCESLKSFTLPSTVLEVGSYLLCGCASLEEVNLPEGMKAIPARFMESCAVIKKIDLPSTIETIDEFAFSECPELNEISLPDGLTDLGRFCFAYCLELKKLPIPESVTTMGHGVFYQAGLIEAALPENITVIPDGTFQCCASLPEFVIGNNVVEVETTAFYWCFALQKITFGEKVATIGVDAFKGDEAITEVICLNPEPAAGASFTNTVYQNAQLTVPEGSLAAYQAADGWKEFLSIKENVGIGSLSAERLSINLQGAELTVSGAETVSLFDASGRKLYQGPAATIPLPARGLYIVKADGRSQKIAY